MYTTKTDREELARACQNNLPYKYIKRLNYSLTHKFKNEFEDYIGIGFYPYIYLEENLYCLNKTPYYYNEVFIIRDTSYEVCENYLNNRNSKSFRSNKNSLGIHTLFIVKELAFEVLNYTDLKFTVTDSRLLNIYKSRKGFGNRLITLNAATDTYKVLKFN